MFKGELTQSVLSLASENNDDAVLQNGQQIERHLGFDLGRRELTSWEILEQRVAESAVVDDWRVVTISPGCPCR